MKPGTLFVVATPIGSLEDISLRALNVLATVDRIVCEHTDVTKKLLFHYDISKPLTALGAHPSDDVIEPIVQKLNDGNDIALVADAGTPTLSDPGGRLVEAAHQTIGSDHVTPIPGPSALTTALSVAGLPADTFVFHGFPPHKKRRQSFFQEVAQENKTVVLYESKHRIKKTLNELTGVLKDNQPVVIARELTKKHEEVIRTTAGKLSSILDALETRGEFVIVIGS